MDEIYDRLKKLPTTDDIAMLNVYINKNIDKVKNDNKSFHEEFQHQSEIIRRYDEVISERASKISLLELKTNLTKLIDKKHLESEIFTENKFN